MTEEISIFEVALPLLTTSFLLFAAGILLRRAGMRAT